MSKFLKAASALAAVSFFAGLAWGYWAPDNRGLGLPLAGKDGGTLRVLCAENWLSEDVLNAFAARHGVSVQLWTYQRPVEFLRQMANSDGHVDVVCTRSVLIRSLIQSHWLRKSDFADLPNMQLVSVDFQQMPYDPKAEYSVPLFWNLYGFFGRGDGPSDETWKNTWTSKRVSLWGEELSLLGVMKRLGVKLEEKLEFEERHPLDQDMKDFVNRAVTLVRPDGGPVSGEALTARSDFAELPLGRVARLLGKNSPYKFWLPADGGAIDVGVLAIGAKSDRPDLAKALINELLSTQHALALHHRLGAGVVHVSLNGSNAVATLQRASALRLFPLNRFVFPDINVEALPRFQKIFDQNLVNRNK